MTPTDLDQIAQPRTPVIPAATQATAVEQARAVAEVAAAEVFEFSVGELVARYEDAAADMPATERIDFNLVELKLA